MKIKICGLTNYTDARAAAEYGAWALGFIFYKKSPRYIEPDAAKEIIDRLPRYARKVGVFVNEDPGVVTDLKYYLNLDAVQMHGTESVEDCGSIKPYVFKAFQLSTEEDVAKIEPYNNVDAVLIDAYATDENGKKVWGGTGQLANWDLAVKAKEFGIPVILSGGLTPKNVKEAAEKVKPYAVDVCSGIEIKPGKKDLLKMQNFFKALTGVGD